MTTGLIVGVHIDDVALRGLSNGSRWQTVTGKHPGETGTQLGMVTSQVAQLLICGGDEFHASTVVVVQHPSVLIDFHDVFEFGVQHDGDGVAGRSIQFELQAHVATLRRMEGTGIGQTVGREIEGEQRHVATGVDDRTIVVIQLGGGLSPHVRQQHGGFASLIGSRGL